MPNFTTDGPPPSPAIDPAAAKETRQPPPPGAQAQQIQGLAPGIGMPQQGADLSGILTLGQKVEESMLTLMQAAPIMAPELEQARTLLMNALGKFANQGGSNGSMPKGPAPSGSVVTPAGAQFPGSVGPKPF